MFQGSFQLIPRRSENEQAEHDLVQDVSQERGRKVGSKNDEYDIAEEFENLSDFKQWFSDKQDNWTNAPECQSWIAAYVAGTNLDAYLTNWNDYKDTRFKYHAVKAREHEPFSCTCQIGIKKELCKHILLVKYEKEEFRWPEEFAALPLNTKFTGGPGSSNNTPPPGSTPTGTGAQRGAGGASGGTTGGGGYKASAQTEETNASNLLNDANKFEREAAAEVAATNTLIGSATTAITSAQSEVSKANTDEQTATALHTQMSGEVANAQTEVNNAQQAINDATTLKGQATASGDATAIKFADDAHKAAVAAHKNAQDALKELQTKAIKEAKDAMNAAQKFHNGAKKAETEAKSFETEAKLAEQEANKFKTDADNFKSQVSKLKTEADQLVSDAGALDAMPTTDPNYAMKQTNFSNDHNKIKLDYNNFRAEKPKIVQKKNSVDAAKNNALGEERKMQTTLATAKTEEATAATALTAAQTAETDSTTPRGPTPGSNPAAPGGGISGTPARGRTTSGATPGSTGQAGGGGSGIAPTLPTTGTPTPINTVHHQHGPTPADHAKHGHHVSEEYEMGEVGGDADMGKVHTDHRWLTCRDRMKDGKCEKIFGMIKHGKHEPGHACHNSKFRLKALNCAATCDKCDEFKRVMRKKLKRQEKRDKRFWIVPRKLRCVDKHLKECPSYIYKCEKKSLWRKLKDECPHSCAYCIPKTEKCQDIDHERCAGWNVKGFCKRPDYPRAVKFFYCARTCLMCPADPKGRHIVPS
ncbi:hypothetical protein DdX_14419 [Ditylenchus destructor]|uniref:SWIM-type domain-containing protein n=1 Tax=Ditylenchus destructor TaxID=166010 RepID=A0AAD4MUI1_9BILA|nr:hypothetical protein DdX_14419 [Ditylenchus destructor]